MSDRPDLWLGQWGYTSAHLPLGELDISSLKFNFKNQDDDYAEIRLRHSWKGAFPFPFAPGLELEFCIKNDLGQFSKRYFSGVVAKPGRLATGDSSSQVIHILGPWARLRTKSFVYSYPYITGAAFSTHGVLGGTANDIINTILSTNAAHICRIGTIDLGNVIIPETEIYNQTVAQVLKSVLRYIPGASVVFDYNFDDGKPAINVLADNSEHLAAVSIDVSDGSSRDVSITPRHDLVVDGVNLQYELNAANKIGQFFSRENGADSTVSSPVTMQSGFFLVGADTAGNVGGGKNILRKTIKMSGYREEITYFFHGQIFPYKNLDFQIPGAGQGMTGQQILRPFAWFFRTFGINTGWQLDPNYNFLLEWNKLGTTQEINRNVLSLGGGNNATSYPAMLSGPTWEPPPSYPYGTAITSTQERKPRLPPGAMPNIFLATPGGHIRAANVGIRWNVFSTPRNEWINLEAPDVLWLDSRDVGTSSFFNWSKTVTNQQSDPIVPVAHTLLAAQSRLMHDGRLVRKYDNPLEVFSGLRRKLQLTPVEVATVAQRIIIDWFSRTTDITFGAPEHLGPQDLISLIKAGDAL